MNTQLINNLNWRIGGEAGFGILNAGTMFSKICLRAGLFPFSVAEYPSLIRGGHNFLNVRISDKEIHSHLRQTDLLIALNFETIERHYKTLSKNSAVIHDEDEEKVKKLVPDHVNLIKVPFKEIAKTIGNPILKNTIAIGSCLALVALDLQLFLDVLTETFSKKGEKVVLMNHEAAKRGYDFVKSHFNGVFPYALKAQEPHDHLMITGNEAITAGAIQAGCKFLAAYPMTPATSIMTNMATQEKNFNLIVKHVEDEIAAINMAIGANYAGVRSMCSTSGGGFSLMTESLGLAAVTETPLVVVDVMRPGPGTGMATHSGQGDLRFLLHASTDESPRIIFTPGDTEECFYLTQHAFNFAEKYQLPVIIISDKHLAETRHCPKIFDVTKVKKDRGKLMSEEDAKKETNYLRYKCSDDSISPRAIPGLSNCMHVTSSYEHNEAGTEDEHEENRILMHDKRYKKLELAKNMLAEPKLVGEKTADFIIINWGSTKGAVREAILQLTEKEISVAHLHLPYVSPFPEKIIKEVFSANENIVIVENNKTGLLAGIIKEQIGKDAKHSIRKYDGRPFFPDEIVNKIVSFSKEVS